MTVTNTTHKFSLMNVCTDSLGKVQILEHDKIDVSEDIDANKTGSSCDCINCLYWYFPKLNFRFQLKVCNRCHDMTQKSMSFDDIGDVTVTGNGYRFCFLVHV